MMKLYGYDTINTLKVLIFLFETETEFDFEPINIRLGAQNSPEFRSINPAGKVPVLWTGDQYQTESNSILLSLATKTGFGLADDPALQADLLAWLFYQASTQGPYFGQIEYWSRLAKVPIPEALAHNRAIATRTIEHLDTHLNDRDYICGDTYSIADTALFPWLNVHDDLGLSLETAENLSCWLDRIRERPATRDALACYNSLTTQAE